MELRSEVHCVHFLSFSFTLERLIVIRLYLRPSTSELYDSGVSSNNASKK
jgi:hypothetical protein